MKAKEHGLKAAAELFRGMASMLDAAAELYPFDEDASEAIVKKAVGTLQDLPEFDI